MEQNISIDSSFVWHRNHLCATDLPLFDAGLGLKLLTMLLSKQKDKL